MDVGTGGCGAPQHMTIIWIKSGVSVRVSFGFHVIKMKKKNPKPLLTVPQHESLCG